ncbi:DUF1624 domain-containing protein [Candidatus Gracilibacteria bacterium]|nr:DUF1624 domain-containing protein [Candidatus Gracilibacteria bacterium]
MRYQSLDILRGLALLGMILFHANYILEEVFYIQTLHFSSLFWYILGKSVAITFIFISGISFFLSVQDKNTDRIIHNALKKCFILIAIAISISIITYLFFYDQRISWGIIHFFALLSLISPFFIRFGLSNIFIGIIVLVLGYFLNRLDVNTNLLIPFGLTPPVYYGADYYPLFPWVGYYLIGYGAASWLIRRGYFDTLFTGSYPILGPLSYVGRHSLLIYILHVPILYGMMLCIFL